MAFLIKAVHHEFGGVNSQNLSAKIICWGVGATLQWWGKSRPPPITMPLRKEAAIFNDTFPGTLITASAIEDKLMFVEKCYEKFHVTFELQQLLGVMRVPTCPGYPQIIFQRCEKKHTIRLKIS